MSHFDVRTQLMELFRQSKSHPLSDRVAILRTVRQFADLHSRNPWVNLRMHENTFMQHLGVTRDQYYRRIRAARALEAYPEMKKAFLKGEVSISTLGTIEGRLTRRNIPVVLENIRGKTKRDAMAIVARITPSGEILDKPD